MKAKHKQYPLSNNEKCDEHYYILMLIGLDTKDRSGVFVLVIDDLFVCLFVYLVLNVLVNN